MPTYSYYIEDHGENPQDAIKFKSSHTSDEVKWIAEDAAEYGHYKTNLFESSWPLTFVILDAGGVTLGRYTVGREYEPVFYAHKKDLK